MKAVNKIQTADGALHDSEELARRHAEKVYGDALSKLVHPMAHLTKYAQWMDYVDRNLSAFVKLAALKADIDLDVETEV